MLINAVAHYLPSKVLDNNYFSALNGLDPDEMFKKSGIIERRVTKDGENTNTMSLEVVHRAIDKLPYSIEEIDLIVGGTYSPYDTVGTLAHVIQQQYDINDAIVTSASSACSTFVNCVEIVEGYFATNKAKNALVVVAEHNTAHCDEKDPIAGHLWGDGSAAVFITKDHVCNPEFEIIDIHTRGLAHIGKGPDGVYNRPLDGGIRMPDGRNVFLNASKYMAQASVNILEKNGYSLRDLNYLVPHQANIRIIDSVANLLDLKKEQTLVNITNLGNTGCASPAIALSQNMDIYKKGDIIVVSVFGGGYSCGAMLLKKV